MKHIADLNYQETIESILSQVSEIKDMVFSTSADDRVSSRVVSTACYGDTIFFMSWGHHLKCKQIEKNPLVSFCSKNLQLEGRAEICGPALVEKNAELLELYKEKQPEYYAMFSQYPGMQIIRVKLHCATRFGYEGTSFYLDSVDMQELKAVRLALEQ